MPSRAAARSIRPVSSNTFRPDHAATEDALTPGASPRPTRVSVLEIRPTADDCASAEPGTPPPRIDASAPASTSLTRRVSWAAPHSVSSPHRGVVRAEPCIQTRAPSRSRSARTSHGSSPVRAVASHNAHATAGRSPAPTAAARHRSISSSSSGRNDPGRRGGRITSIDGSPSVRRSSRETRNSVRTANRRKYCNDAPGAAPLTVGASTKPKTISGVTASTASTRAPRSTNPANWHISTSSRATVCSLREPSLRRVVTTAATAAFGMVEEATQDTGAVSFADRAPTFVPGTPGTA